MLIRFFSIRRLVILLFVITLLTAAVGMVVYPAPLFRAAFTRIEARTDVDISFDRAYFSYGRQQAEDSSRVHLTFNGLTLKRQAPNMQDHHGIRFDLKAETVQIEIFPDFGRVSVAGLRGLVERVGNDKAIDPADKPKNHTADKTVFGNNVADTFRLRSAEDIEVDFIDQTLAPPFFVTIRIESFSINDVAENHTSLFAPLIAEGIGKISSPAVPLTDEHGSPDNHWNITVGHNYPGETPDIRQHAQLPLFPLILVAPYFPILDEIFVAGRMNIQLEDISTANQKAVRILIVLLPDCQLRSVDAVLGPILQAAMEHLDDTTLPDLLALKDRIDRLHRNTEELRSEVDRVMRIVDRFSVLTPPDVRAEYDRFRTRYNRARADFDEWNGKFNRLVQDLDRAKIRVVEDTFRQFIESGNPIVVELYEIDGRWEYDVQAVLTRLLEDNYRLVMSEQQLAIRDIQRAVERLLGP